MIDDKPACPTHGVRFISRGRGGGITAKFGQWFQCGLCDFKKWIAEDENALIVSAMTCWAFVLVLHLT